MGDDDGLRLKVTVKQLGHRLKRTSFKARLKSFEKGVRTFSARPEDLADFSFRDGVCVASVEGMPIVDRLVVFINHNSGEFGVER